MKQTQRGGEDVKEKRSDDVELDKEWSSVKVAAVAVALLEDRSLRSRTRTHQPQAGKDFPGEVHERGAGLINKLTC